MAIGRVEYHRLKVTARPVRLVPRPEHLAGREDLLAELDARLPGGDGPGPRTIALCGLGGAGKTSVAVEYAYRHLAGLGVVWQFAAEDPAVLSAGFSDLAAALGARDLLDAGDPVAQVHGALAARPGDWLLMFDNTTDSAAVRGLLPPAGRGQVLITSQNPHWPGQALEVPVLDRETAAAFLVRRAGATGQAEAALALAGELGGLPLALEQAAAYMLATGHSISRYLELFRQRRLELLARGQPVGYDKQVTTTWRLALDQLQQTAPQAAGLLRLLACCAPEAIPLDLLLQPRPGLLERFDVTVAPVVVPLLRDPLAASDAVAALRRYSLISQPHDGAVSVHRLVQAITLAQVPAEEARAWRHAAGSLIEAALPGDARQPANWPVYAALLPHAQAALPADSEGMATAANYLGQIGNYPAARALHQQVLNAREQLSGAECPTTLIARADLARWTGEAGDAAGARDQYAALLPVHERVLGAEHKSTLGTRANLARWTGEAGDAAGDRDQYAALLPDQERVLGAEHPRNLTARANFAYFTGEAGDAAGDRDQYAALLPAHERVFGAESLRALIARANLARWTGEAGDVAGARDQYAALLPVHERIMGAEHPRTLRTRANVARWTGEAGDAAGACGQYAALLPAEERVLGAEHPRTLTARAGLARWTGEAGDAAGARDQFAALLRVTERVLGPEHPNTLDVRAGLARWTGEAGDFAGARDQLAALLPVCERVSGPEHPSTLSIRRGLAQYSRDADGGPGPA